MNVFVRPTPSNISVAGEWIPVSGVVSIDSDPRNPDRIEIVLQGDPKDGGQSVLHAMSAPSNPSPYWIKLDRGEGNSEVLEVVVAGPILVDGKCVFLIAPVRNPDSES